MDSIEITIVRTGAATGVAAKYLAPLNARIATVCGCGNQGKISVRALAEVRKLEKIYAFDTDNDKLQNFRNEFSGDFQIVPVSTNDLPSALRETDILVTCTPSKIPFIKSEDIKPGTFIAAVGADNEEKQELFSELLASNKVVVDLVEQCATMGELHHAIQQRLMSKEQVHAELGEIIAGKIAGRNSAEEIIIFDSTGTALQDVAAAAIVYEKATATGSGTRINFSEQHAIRAGTNQPITRHSSLVTHHSSLITHH